MTFSASTCLALLELLPDALVNVEFQRLKDRVPAQPSTPLRSTPSGTKTRTKSSLATKKEHIKMVLIDSVANEVSERRSEERELIAVLREVSSKLYPPRTTREVGTVTDSLCVQSISTETCNAAVPIPFPVPVSSPAPVTPSSSSSHAADPVTDFPPRPSSPIVMSGIKHSLDLDRVVSDLNMKGTNNIRFHKPGRSFGGSVPFPCPPPASLEDALGIMTSVDPEFDIDEHSCNIMRLNPGRVQTLRVEFADPSAPLYCLIVGGSCKLECLNVIGPVEPSCHALNGGDIFQLPGSSIGKFSFDVSPVSGPVMLIVFMKPRSHRNMPKPPPIGLPGSTSNPKKDILLGRSTSRTLFLSDSILRNVDASSLVSGRNSRCIKKTSFYLTDFHRFEPELEYSDKFIVSAGINDLTRLKMLPEQICDIVVPQLRRLCSKYPNTSFIFNSILLTTCPKTNNYVLRLNEFLSDAIKNLPNAFFFNSHSILKYSNLRSVYTDRGSMGIHINNQAVSLIRRELVSFLRRFKTGGFKNR